MDPCPSGIPQPAQRSRSTRSLRLGAASVGVGCVLLLTACGAAEVAQQQVEQAVNAVGESAAAQAENLLGDALSGLPSAQLAVSEQNRASFAELRTELEQVNAQALELLAAPQDLSAAGLEPLQGRLATLQTSVEQRAAALTGISVEEQQAWAELAQSVQVTSDQVGLLAGLLG